MFLITLCQAIDLRGGCGPLGRGDKKIYETVRKQVAFMERDRPLENDIAKVKEMIKKQLIKIPEG